MPRIPVPDPIDFLIQRKFNAVRDRGSGGWQSGNSGSAVRTSEEKSIEEFEAELLSKSEAEIAALVEAERQRETEQQATPEIVPWYDAPEFQADYDYWCKAAYWKDVEAIALSLGKEPAKFNQSRQKSVNRHSAINTEFNRRLELVNRMKIARDHIDLSKPSTFLSWAREIGLTYPPELDVVLSRPSSLMDWKARYEQEAVAHAEARQELEELRRLSTRSAAKPLPLRERDSMLKIIIGLAMEELGYDPSEARSPIPREISDILQRRGIGLADDTVRKYLQEARELLPQLQTD